MINNLENCIEEGSYITYQDIINQCKKALKDLEEYQEQNQEYTRVVNDWLSGKTDDTAIMEIAYDCSDDAIGIFNLIAIICYLKKRNIID